MNPATESQTTAEHARDAVAILDEMIAAAPEAIESDESCEDSQEGKGTGQAAREISPRTQVPKRYRAEWDRPTDERWQAHFDGVMRKTQEGGIVALIGPRGTGKTRLAAEAVRNIAPNKATYTTAMGLFLRIRASFGKTSQESENEIVQEMAKASLLVLDEVQERGNSPWEDRILTHILDRRYGAMLPTIVIANLSEPDLVQCLGPSIISRLQETGGIIEVNGPSHRIA